MTLRLRELALNAVEAGLPTPAAEHPRVSGVVVDIPGGGSDRFALLVAADRELERFDPDRGEEFPPAGVARIHVLTPGIVHRLGQGAGGVPRPYRRRLFGRGC